MSPLGFSDEGQRATDGKPICCSSQVCRLLLGLSGRRKVSWLNLNKCLGIGQTYAHHWASIYSIWILSNFWRCSNNSAQIEVFEATYIHHGFPWQQLRKPSWCLWTWPLTSFTNPREVQLGLQYYPKWINFHFNSLVGLVLARKAVSLESSKSCRIYIGLLACISGWMEAS